MRCDQQSLLSMKIKEYLQLLYTGSNFLKSHFSNMQKQNFINQKVNVAFPGGQVYELWKRSSNTYFLYITCSHIWTRYRCLLACTKNSVYEQVKYRKQKKLCIQNSFRNHLQIRFEIQLNLKEQIYFQFPLKSSTNLTGHCKILLLLLGKFKQIV